MISFLYVMSLAGLPLNFITCEGDFSLACIEPGAPLSSAPGANARPARPARPVAPARDPSYLNYLSISL